LAAYYGLVEYHDRLCGRVLDALRRTRLADNTVVVYTKAHATPTRDYWEMPAHANVFPMK
jgi:arylsulfatase A-like enzyme